MSKFIGLFIGVIALATLAGAAIGWRFPFLGQNQSANQLENAPEATENRTVRSVSQAPLGTSQPNRTTVQAQNPQQTAQAPQPNQGDTVIPEPAPTDANQPIPALW